MNALHMLDHALSQELFIAAAALLTEDHDATPGLRPGVRVLDRWSDGDYGGVLFWVSQELDLWGFGKAVLHTVSCELIDGAWQERGGGGGGARPAGEILARTGPGLHRHGSHGSDPLRLTRAIASPDVASIQLRSDVGVSERQPGIDGFCLIGITHQDPITYAHALDAAGLPLPGEPLLL
jgi:hypothetical protein